jgi:DNA helicase-2/ATP-dependent DNA helicase PcrA
VSFTATEAYRLVMHTHSSTHRTENRDESGELAQFLKHKGSEDDEISAAELHSYVTLDFWHVYCRGPDSVDDLVTIKSSEKDILRSAIEHNDDPVADVDNISVRVYTVHGSKGAEARTVVLYDGITRRIEDSMFESSRLRDNEYRTWFVGLTRAKENLFVLRDAFEGTSRFLPPLNTTTTTTADGTDTQSSTNTTNTEA